MFSVIVTYAKNKLPVDYGKGNLAITMLLIKNISGLI